MWFEWGWFLLYVEKVPHIKTIKKLKLQKITNYNTFAVWKKKNIHPSDQSCRIKKLPNYGGKFSRRYGLLCSLYSIESTLLRNVHWFPKMPPCQGGQRTKWIEEPHKDASSPPHKHLKLFKVDKRWSFSFQRLRWKALLSARVPCTINRLKCPLVELKNKCNWGKRFQAFSPTTAETWTLQKWSMCNWTQHEHLRF